MFTPSGHIDHLTFAGVRKGGGGGPDPRFTETTLTDPISGRSFTSTPFSVASGGQSAAQQLNAEITQRQADEAAKSQQADAAKQAAANTAESTFQTNRQTAYNDALQNVIRQFQLQGVDPNAYMTTDIQPTLQRQFNSIADLDPNPAAAFPTTLGDQIIGNVTSGKRTQATAALNNLFTPNFTTNLIPDSTLAGPTEQILNEQFDPLRQQLTNAVNRNLLTPSGFTAANDLLGQKLESARGTITNLGRGILDTDRSHIDDIISGARNAASGLTINQTFDPSAFGGQATSRATSDLANFAGALRGAVGDTKFTDINELLNRGGVAQGAVNPFAQGAINPIPGTSPFFQTPEQLAQQKRGLGNQGAF